MKATILSSNLKEGLENVSYATVSSGSLPILSYILLNFKKGGLEICSTNLEIGIKVKIRAKVDQEGKITVPFKTFYEFVSNNPDEKINLFKKGKELKIKTNHFQANLLSIDPEEFPLLPQLEKPKEIKVKKEDFIKGAQKVVIAPSLDEIRPVLSGVLFWLKPKELRLVGTDSFRLAEQKIVQKSKVLEEIKVILPLRAVQVGLRILSKSFQDDFLIRFSENQLELKIDEHSIVGRLIEGEYPDYAQIIPNSYETRLILDKEEFEKTLKILSSFSQEANKEVKFKIEDKKLILEARSAQIGSNVAKVDGKIEGSSTRANFNANFLLDGLGVIEEKQVVFDLTGEISPGVLRGRNTSDFTYLVMPLKQE